jgi:hypothetical protein
MAPWEVLLLAVWVGYAFVGYEIGKHNGLCGLILGLARGDATIGPDLSTEVLTGNL